MPRDRNKTLTALVGAEPIVEAHAGAVQRLQFFLSESPWDAEAVNASRLAVLLGDPATAPHADGVLVITDHPDYARLDLPRLLRSLRIPAVVYDCWRILDERVVRAAGVRYAGIGYA